MNNENIIYTEYLNERGLLSFTVTESSHSQWIKPLLSIFAIYFLLPLLKFSLISHHFVLQHSEQTIFLNCF